MKKKQRNGSSAGRSEQRIMMAFLLNLVFTFVEIWGCIVTGSVTILSDSIHDFGDCVALLMAWRMEKLSKRPANERYHFGYGRFSVVAGLINNLILLLGGVVLIVVSVQRFFDPRPIDGRGMLMFAVFGILINGTAMLLTAKGRNINEKTVSMHMLEDVLTWVAVFVVGIVMCFHRLPALDSLLSIGMTLVIFVGVWRNLKKIFAVLTLRSPLDPERYRELQEGLAKLDCVGVPEAVRLYSVDGEKIAAEICFVLYEETGVEDMMQLYSAVKACGVEFGISEEVIQIRYEVNPGEETLD